MNVHYSLQQLTAHFKIASREDFGCSMHKEMINVWSDGYANYPLIHCTHILKCNSVPHKYLQLLSVNEKLETF